MPAQAKGVVHQPQSELEILQAAIGHLQGITNQMLEQRNQMKALELYRKLQPKSRSLWQDWAIGFWFSCSMRVNVNTKGIVKLRRKP